ncbi:MAG: choice-of-anchor D domain-containing protein [Verrucomicrobia bacterium]|nr:choice-of-anchor D domain-containing protein [Verrucomicrobiota bacterium]
MIATLESLGACLSVDGLPINRLRRRLVEGRSGSRWIGAARRGLNPGFEAKRRRTALAVLLGGLFLALTGPSSLLGGTVTLSPASDAYVNDSDPLGTYNNAWLVAGHSPAEFTPRYRSFLRFNLSGIPSNATISSAVLRLNLQAVEGGSAAGIELRRVLASWTSTTLTWNNQPAPTTPVTTTPVGSTLGADYNWPITGLAQGWVSGQYSNYGLTLRIVNEATATATRTFASASHATTSIRPELIVTYTLPPDINVVPTSLAFGNQSVGTSSAAQTVTVQNNGGSDLTVSSIASSSADFVVTVPGGLPATVVTNSSLMFQVRFAPTSSGTKSATVTITSDDPDEPTRTVACGGTGTAPDITVAPGSLAFGNQVLNTLSPPQTLTVSNTGNGTLSVNAISTSSGVEFPLSNVPSLPANLAPGTSLSFQVRFKPASIGARSETVSILSNDPDEMTVPVACTGTGTASDITVAPGTLAFGNQTLNTLSAPKTVTVSNGGNATLTVNAITTSSAEFPLSNVPGLPASLAPGSALTFLVRFNPASVGARSGTVSILSNDPDEMTVPVTCTGNGITPNINLAPTALAFGNQLVGSLSITQTVTIQNTGSADLHVTGISSSSSRFLLTLGTNLPATIVPGGSLPFGVRFAPTSVGLKSASVTVLSDDPDEMACQFPAPARASCPTLTSCPRHWASATNWSAAYRSLKP